MKQRSVLPALSIYAIFYLAFLYAPVLLLPIFSFNDSIFIAFPLKGFTLDAYRQMLGNPGLLEAFLTSVKAGCGVAIVSTILGYFGAKAVTRYNIPGRGVITGFIVLPLVVPALVLAVALLVLVRRALHIDLSIYTLSAGHILLCTPLSMLVLISRLEGFDRSLEEASADLGDSAWESFWRITLPLNWPGILSSLLLCFSISFDEYIIASFLCGDSATLPVFIFSQLRFPQNLPGVLALASSMLVASIVLVVSAEWVRRLGVPRKDPGQYI